MIFNGSLNYKFEPFSIIYVKLPEAISPDFEAGDDFPTFPYHLW